MATNKHITTVGLDRQGNPIRILTPAGKRRVRRRRTLWELFQTAFRNGDSVTEAFQDACRMYGARLDDRRWLLNMTRAMGVLS